jgi:hypothetical protein
VADRLSAPPPWPLNVARDEALLLTDARERTCYIGLDQDEVLALVEDLTREAA